MLTFADKAILFFSDLKFSAPLPEGISVMNPFAENSEVMKAVTGFYRKFYSDTRKRRLIMGINPGRFGAGVTGIPFTDTVRLSEKCGLSIPGTRSYETSSVFIYDMIERYGGPSEFYGDYYISAVSPLGFTSAGRNGKMVNYNYYDSRELTENILDFVVDSLKKQLEFGIERDVCFCLGTGKNFSFLSKLNSDLNIFKRIEPLEHPRFIMQYRLKRKEYYLGYYVEKLKS